MKSSREKALAPADPSISRSLTKRAENDAVCPQYQARARATPCVEEITDDRHPDREQRARAEALDRASRDELIHVGGETGALARTVINPGPGEQLVHGKQSREFEHGDVISFQQSGAGGYGDPFTRDPARVLSDVLDDYVSLDAARERYGVVITAAGGDLAVDAAATVALRARAGARQHQP